MNDKDLGSIRLISVMAVVTAMLRLSIAAANTVMLWLRYGYEVVRRDHLTIAKVKPEIVVSNGDVLYGTSLRHYAIGVSIWLLSSVSLLLVLYKYVLPIRLRRELEASRTNTVGAVGALWAVGLFFLVPGLFPLGAAMTLALLSLLFALHWAWRAAPIVE
jgi:hypothetical protein